MSFMTKLFAGRKGVADTLTPGYAIQRLLEVEEMLEKKQQYLEAKSQQELLNAKKFGTKNKRAALKALKNKKKYEKQLTKIDGILTTIEYQREALENVSTTAEIYKVLGISKAALDKAHGQISIEKVEDLMADLQDQHELSRELEDAFSVPIGFDKDFDEDELSVELEALMEKDLLEDLTEIPSTENLPNLPVPKPAHVGKSKVKNDKGLEELAAWAS